MASGEIRAAVAKAFASEALPAVAARAIRVLGGVGFTWEIDAQFYYKRLLSLQHLFARPRSTSNKSRD